MKNILPFVLLVLVVLSCTTEENIIDPNYEIKQAFEAYEGTAFGLPEGFTINWADVQEVEGLTYFPATPAYHVHASDTLGIFNGPVPYQLVAEGEADQLRLYIAKLRPFTQGVSFTGSKLLYDFEANLIGEQHFEEGELTRYTPAEEVTQETKGINNGRT